LLKELSQLQEYAGGKSSLEGLTVVISHIKPSLKAGIDTQSEIMQQLQQGNTLGVKFVRMQQGDKLAF